eukprot:tig00020830_g14412.t1
MPCHRWAAPISREQKLFIVFHYLQRLTGVDGDLLDRALMRLNPSADPQTLSEMPSAPVSAEMYVKSCADAAKDLTEEEFGQALADIVGHPFEEVMERYVQAAVAWGLDKLVQTRPPNPVQFLANSLLEFESRRTGRPMEAVLRNAEEAKLALAALP